MLRAIEIWPMKDKVLLEAGTGERPVRLGSIDAYRGLVMFLMIILIVFGYQAAVHAGRQVSPGLQIKMSVPYSFVPIGAGLVTVQLIPIILKEWKRAFSARSRI